MQIKILEEDTDIQKSFNLVQQLVPTITKEQFLRKIKSKQQQGYTAVILQDNASYVAYAGIRIYDYFAKDKILFIDDLVVDKEHRNEGLGTLLFKEIVNYAIHKGCSEIQLDSSVKREQAHTFYKKQGMKFTHKHFSKDI